MPDKTAHHHIQAEQSDTGEMSFIGHLEELRRRLIICLIAVGISSAVSYFYAQELVHFITAPAGKLYYMNPAEAFFTYLKVSFFAGFLVSLPVILYQIWSFIVPALTANERTVVNLLVPVSVVLFFIGLAFSYYLVLPAGIKFFMGFATEDLQPMFSLGQYLSFVISFLAPFGFIFELPLFILVLAKFGFVSSGFLILKRKIVLVLAFVIGAVISPTPDVFSQTMVAVPVILLYELSVFIVKYILRK
ncbi:twin-arginine translocase subunit TatC|uniref:Sec-independent protein translocase protein TatC n=1 Tax=Dendrosporobacter quercicolus TaxID=146817 RepID=A0A1G9N4E2_9FIRM|nr:twin-arginine translocase subunit TatC [Dendrosporobacter quercicolus]NSL47228.1 twin-arginine translocase subunit TatC [Dendrosporobacter quercicolus DSM 1736]SDL81389.1 sec-independent protein translocase protein TatC [Dendrosporobacter quercicolus]